MSNASTIRASIQVNVTSTTYPDQNGGQTQIGDVYVELYDSITGQPVPGNGVTVSYISVDQSGNANTGFVVVPGTNTSVIIYSGILQDSHYDALGNQIYFNFINFSISKVDTSTVGSTGSTYCDLVIESATTTSESATGANDGTATILAKTSHPAIKYSLDNSTFQTLNKFTGLSSGTYTVYCQDGNGCLAQYQFYLARAQSILVSDPSKTDGSNVSRWNAAFNPILFSFQRKDFVVANVLQPTPGGSIYFLSTTGFINPLPKNGETIYINVGPYQGLYTVASNDANGVYVNTAYLGTVTSAGFININSERLYYKIVLEIAYTDPSTGLANTQLMTCTPNQKGYALCDISGLIKSILRPMDTFIHNVANYSDPNLCLSYRVSYAEEWKNNPGTFIPLPSPFYAVYSAFQIQESGCDNLLPYVPFPSVSDPSKLAAWPVDFENPVLNNGLPFDVPFIYSEALTGLPIQVSITQLDINKVPIGSATTSLLLNKDGSYILNEDGTHLIISGSVSAGSSTLVEQIGLNRLNLTGIFPSTVWYLSVYLFYINNAGTSVPLTKTLLISVSKAVQDNYFYLKWIGKHGSWNYYLFNYNQSRSLTVQNMQLVKKKPTNWLTAAAIEKVTSKESNEKVTVYAEGIPRNDADGLEGIYDSPEVMVYVNGSWQTVILDIANFILYDTREFLANIKFTFNYSTKNVQTQ